MNFFLPSGPYPPFGVLSKPSGATPWFSSAFSHVHHHVSFWHAAWQTEQTVWPQLSVNPPLASSLSRHHLNYYTALLLTLLAFDHLFTGWTDSLRYELQGSNWIESQACTFPCNLALINAHLLLTVISWS